MCHLRPIGEPLVKNYRGYITEAIKMYQPIWQLRTICVTP